MKTIERRDGKRIYYVFRVGRSLWAKFSLITKIVSESIPDYKKRDLVLDILDHYLPSLLENPYNIKIPEDWIYQPTELNPITVTRKDLEEFESTDRRDSISVEFDEIDDTMIRFAGFCQNKSVRKLVNSLLEKYIDEYVGFDSNAARDKFNNL